MWLGVKGIKGEIDKIISELETTLPKIVNGVFANTAWLDSDYPKLLEMLKQTATKYGK